MMLTVVLCLGGASVAYALFDTGKAQRTQLAVIDQRVDLAPLGQGWETMCILGPYSNNDIARQVSGRDIDVDTRSRIRLNDSIALLMTLHGATEANLYEVRRRPSDFSKLHGTCWPFGTEFRVAAEGHPYVLSPDRPAK